jgi:hypothetical protein
MDGPRRAPPGSSSKTTVPVPPTARSYPEVVTGTRNPVRRVFHILLIVIGWILFVLFWYYIFFKGTGEGASQTFVILLITMLGIIAINWLWVAFNLSLYKLRGSRTAVRHVPFTATRDVLGRTLVTPGWSAVQEARIVDVTLDTKGEVKRYVTGGDDPKGSRKVSP